MPNRRTIGVFSAAFAVVLLAGIFFAQVGTWTPQAPKPAEVAFAPGAEYVASSAPTTTLEAVPALPASTAGSPATSPFASPAAQPEPLVITFPTNGDRFTDQYVTFTGTAPEGWAVTAAGYAASRDGSAWSIRLILSPGRNDATLYATSPDGAVIQEASVTAYYDVPSASPAPVPTNPAPTSTAGATAAPASFTAHQKYGEHNAPFDVFWGEGRPGDTIRAYSDFGAAETRVGPKGFWDMRVSFREAPAGQPFAVMLQDGSGTTLSFTFMRLAGPDGDDDDGEKGDHSGDDGNATNRGPGHEGDQGDDTSEAGDAATKRTRG